MAPTEFEYQGHLIRATDGVLELFARGVMGSMRVPIALASAGLDPQKHEMVRVEIGMGTDPDGPFFASPAFRNAAFNFQIPATDEPRLRGFLEEAARSARRIT